MQPDIARNVFWFDLQCYVDAPRRYHGVFCGKERANIDKRMKIRDLMRDTSGDIPEQSQTSLMLLMYHLNQYMVRNTLLSLAGGRQIAQRPKCELLIFTSFLVTLGPDLNTR